MESGRQEHQEIRWMIAREIPALRRYAHILMRGHGDTDDLVQDTLERAIRKSHTWRREGNIRSWLYRIQYTVFLNKYLKRRPQDRPQDDSDAQAAATALHPPQEKELEYKRVMEIADGLKPAYRDVLLLVTVEGFTYDQVAQIMDIPVGTVRSRLSRAREEILAEIKNPRRPVTPGRKKSKRIAS